MSFCRTLNPTGGTDNQRSLLLLKMATLTYEATRPISCFSKEKKVAASYGIVTFNGADEIIYQDQYESQNAFAADVYARISKLSNEFAMLNLYAPDDARGCWPLNGHELRKVCEKHNVFFTKNRYTSMWSFIPMDISVFQRVYEWQQVFQFTFYPKSTGTSWNLDARFVALLAEQGRCTLLSPPDGGVWCIEPWEKVEEAN